MFGIKSGIKPTRSGEGVLGDEERILDDIIKEVHRVQESLDGLRKKYDNIQASQENIIDGLINKFIEDRNMELKKFADLMKVFISELSQKKKDNILFMKLKTRILGDPGRWPSKFGGPWVG